MTVIYALAGVLAFTFLVSLALSFMLTHRHYLGEVSSPAEVGLEYEEVSFTAADGITLRGWWVPGADRRCAAILLHGHGGSMDPDVRYLPPLHQAGLSVLMFDFRAHGRSQGKTTTFGYLEARDVQAAVAFLASRGVERVALVGFSLGGMVALVSAPLCSQVAAVVDDGAPARLRSAVRGWAAERRLPGWLAPILGYLAIVGASLRVGANLFAYEPVRWVGKIAPRPLLLIHGDLDQYVPDFDDLARAAGAGTEIWRLPDAGHVQASRIYTDEYFRRLVGFLVRHLRPETQPAPIVEDK